MSKPFFSVVIPTYNCADFLKECLTSVLEQTYRNFEVIIIDNYSVDHTENVVKSFNDDRLVYLKFKNNGVIAASRNQGVSLSEGEWIAFLDADDLWTKNKLEVIKLNIEQNSDRSIFCHSEYIIDSKSRVNGSLDCSKNVKVSYEDLLFDGNRFSTSATTVRKESFLSVGGFSEDTKFITVEDYDLWMRLVKAGAKALFIEEKLGYYRIHDSNSIKAFEKHYNAELSLLDFHFNELSSQDSIGLDKMQRRYALLEYGMGRLYWKDRKFNQAKLHFKKALKTYFFLPKNLYMLIRSYMKLNNE